MRATEGRGFQYFLDQHAERKPELIVVNNGEPQPLVDSLKKTLLDQPVEIREVDEAKTTESYVALVEDGSFKAISTFAELRDTFLLVNSDLYRTGTSGFDSLKAPDVLTEMSDTRFVLEGFPVSNKQKLILTILSRYIEQRAYQSGSGTLHASFQRFSRLTQERGTRHVYEQLGETDLDVHAYGVPDTSVDDLPITTHGGYSPPYRRTWFVVYQPPSEQKEVPDSTQSGAALVAVEQDDNTWEGMWTYRPDLVDEILNHVRTAL